MLPNYHIAAAPSYFRDGWNRWVWLLTGVRVFFLGADEPINRAVINQFSTKPGEKIDAVGGVCAFVGFFLQREKMWERHNFTSLKWHTLFWCFSTFWPGNDLSLAVSSIEFMKSCISFIFVYRTDQSRSICTRCMRTVLHCNWYHFELLFSLCSAFDVIDRHNLLLMLNRWSFLSVSILCFSP